MGVSVVVPVVSESGAEVGVTQTARPDFDSWVAARGPALLRLAHLLAGDAGDGDADDEEEGDEGV